MLRRKRTSLEADESNLVALATSCSDCGSPLEAGDVYCASCGAAVARPPAVDDPEPRAQQTTEAEIDDRARRRIPRWIRFALLAVLLAAVAAVFSVLALAWTGERSDRRAAEASLASAGQEIGALEEEVSDVRSELADTEADLGASQDLIDAQEIVLSQTEKVLGRVDPLLSAVDNLRLLAGQIQDDRDAFRSNAEGLRDDLVGFASYLVETSPLDYDYPYISSEIDYLNGQLDDFAGAAAALDDRDRAYAQASQRFDNRANGYSEAVRRLERALARVGE